MLLGHYAVALAAKRYAPRTSLGTLILAAQLLDLLWPIFVLVGWERVRIVPGLMPASPFDFEHYPVSHSLLAALLWAGLFAGGYLVFRRYARGAAVIAIAIVSHWVLDAIVHRKDLPLWPGGSTRIGFGLWNSVAGTLIVELVLLGIGVAIYTRTTQPRERTGTRGLQAMIAALVLLLLAALFGPPPQSERTLAIASLALWIFVPWGHWLDGRRETSRLHGRLG
jgi:membrane-bound metal-dependent hydrolase YbcI (DUF457 family)